MIGGRGAARLLLGVGLTVAACGDLVDEGFPTAVELSADRTTAAIAEPITFHFEAQGRRLAGVILDYGDGVQDSINTDGARTAAGERSHAYAVSGSFLVHAHALETSGDSATAVLQVEVPEQDS